MDSRRERSGQVSVRLLNLGDLELRGRVLQRRLQGSGEGHGRVLELLKLGEQVVREGVNAGLRGCERGSSGGGNGASSFRRLLTEKGSDTDESI